MHPADDILLTHRTGINAVIHYVSTIFFWQQPTTWVHAARIAPQVIEAGASQRATSTASKSAASPRGLGRGAGGRGQPVKARQLYQTREPWGQSRS